ncbi:MAG: DUF3365 domain-containing protein [Bdellovibrionaceae bacterium]|nr:DUF3365 domain-containing protein [Pseudobdellovibrionaceae bacterium]
MKSRLLAIQFVFMITSFAHADSSMQNMVQAVESVNDMRESLVSGVKGNVTPTTFKAVCKPVGKRAKMIAKKNGWIFRQVSYKNRNSNSTPNELEAKAIVKFEQNKKLVSYFEQESDRIHYYRRISVQSSCLNCHGNKESRPHFIQKKYPHDKAFGFKTGDLRAIYSVIKVKQ